MIRLVYAPKAYVFIRSSNMGGPEGRLYDVSEDVVSGEVRRVTGDVSKAQIVLRNRNRRYIRDPKTKRQIFLPMDLITIWLQRVSGKPIQVFTGYLDSVPYLQLFPGNCQIAATCTLKKLAYTWFDPGLSFFKHWVESQGTNWQFDQTTGEGYNLPLNYGGTQTRDPFQRDVVNDGSFGKLTYDFMTQIAGWPGSEVIISNIDPKLPAKAAKLFQRVTEQTQADYAQLTEHMKQMMGVNVQTNADGTNTDGTIPPEILTTMQQIKKNASNIDMRVLVVAALALTQQLNPTYSQDPSTGSHWGYGLYAFRPKGHAVARPVRGPFVDNQYAYENAIDGVPISELNEAGKATELMVRRLMKTVNNLANPTLTPGFRNGSSLSPKARKIHIQQYIQAASDSKGGDNQKLREWIETSVGYKIHELYWQAAIQTATKYLLAFSGDSTGASQKPTFAVRTRTLANLPIFDFSNPDLLKLLDDGEKSMLDKFYKKAGALQSMLPFLYAAKKSSPSIKLSHRAGQHKESLYLKGPDKQMKEFFDTFTGNPDAPRVTYHNSGLDFWKSQFGTRIVTGDNPDSDQDVDESGNLTGYEASMAEHTMRIIVTADLKVPAFLTIPQELGSTAFLDEEEGAAPSKAEVQARKFSDFAKFSADAAFAVRFSFPIDMLESQHMTGDKALMNDVSCLDGIKQFCKASMRNFMSLPDGRFIAFYPDYFGSIRKPYWWIRDIEIVDMGIQLNDEALATHVFTPGDIHNGSGEIDFLDKVNSRGVVSIMHVGILESFIEELNLNLPHPAGHGRLANASAFLDHYGARPFMEEQPLIRNGSFEFLYAYQTFMLKWAQQFATDVTFTFQPELMAGGIVGFPDHGIQMYVESVTHTFDYESGFRTDAVLSAPSIMADQDNFRRRKYAGKYPGFALAGNDITFGDA